MHKTKLESAFQQQVIKYLEERNIWYFRAMAIGSSFGLPDIIAIYKGYFVGIECKRDEHSKRTQLQELMQQSIVNAGGFYEFVWSISQVASLLERVGAHAN
jgi:Holliday junction resolvase